MKISIASPLIILICTFMLLGGVAPNSSAAENAPNLEINTPTQQEYRDYLGLNDTPSKTFKLTDVKADILVIELFSMYCSFCQNEAPRVNELYDRLQELEEHRDIVVRMIGLGASNTTFEVEHFKETYQVQFPMFPDKDFALYDTLKGQGTPEFIVYTLNVDDEPKIVLRNSGGFDSAAEFMKELLTKSGY